MILKNYETLDEIPETELERYDYFIIPAILHWEDRATSWSGIPDKVEVEIEIFNSKKELLKSAILSGQSASMTLGSTDPSELLEEPIRTFLRESFDK